jgi:hypothetical protein
VKYELLPTKPSGKLVATASELVERLATEAKVL